MWREPKVFMFTVVPPPRLKWAIIVDLSCCCLFVCCICCCISAHSSKTHGDESRPELVLRMTLSSLAISVLHIDPLPSPHDAPSPLGPMAAHFFNTVVPSQLAPSAFFQSRTVFNQACPYDHLRWSFIFHSIFLSQVCSFDVKIWLGHIFAGL